MVDNVAITAGSGTNIATDNIGGVNYQRVKVNWGPDNTCNDADVATGKPLPVQLRGSDGTDRSNALPVTLASTTITGTVAVTDNSGSLTVDGSVTANAGTNLNTANIESYTSRLLSGSVPVAGGAATATTGQAVGGTYNSTPITITDTQQAGLQLDANGYLKTSIVAMPASNTNGQALAANSGPVVIASDQMPLFSTLVKGMTAQMTGTTSTSLLTAPGSAKYNYITSVTISNAHGTVGTEITLQDGSGGTAFWTFPAAPAYGGATINFSPPLKQTTSNTALYCANLTTGSATKVSVNGFTGA